MTDLSNRALSADAAYGLTIPSRQRDFAEWHQGRPRFAVWAIALDDTDVHARLGEVRRVLDPMLLPGYQRQPHITLQVCGFPVDAPARPDDFGRHHLQAQLDALARLGQTAFEVCIGEAFTFASAACLSVGDEARALARLRTACQDAAPSSDTTPYVPHVTAGLYAGTWPLREVHARLQSIRTLPAQRLRVGSLDWMCYDSTRIAGPLSTVLRVDLDSGRMRVVDADLLRLVFTAPPTAPAPPRVR